MTANMTVKKKKLSFAFILFHIIYSEKPRSIHVRLNRNQATRKYNYCYTFSDCVYRKLAGESAGVSREGQNELAPAEFCGNGTYF